MNKTYECKHCREIFKVIYCKKEPYVCPFCGREKLYKIKQ